MLLRCIPIALFTCSSLAVAQRPGQTLFDDVVRALGGSDKVLAVQSLIVQGEGENYNLGQNATPDTPLPTFGVTKYVRAYDFANRRWRLDQTREPRFPAGNPAPQRQRFGYDVVAYDITSDTTMRRIGQRPTLDRRAELMYHPVGFIYAALEPESRLAEESSADGTRRLRLDAGGERYTMVVDRRTRLPIRIERTVHNGMLGDAVLSNDFSDWNVVSSVRLPMRIVQKLDGRMISDMKLTAPRANVVVGELAIPESIRTAQLQTPPVSVVVDSIASGVWYLTGGTHHSVAIEMKDGILLVEAPHSEERTLAVIRTARGLRPGKPVRAVVNSHHHFDHAGGIRAALSEDLTIFTHAANAPFYQALANRRFTIQPDALAKGPKPANIQAVTTKRVLTDGSRIVELHEIQGSVHSGSMLVAWMPAEKILIEADLYTPQAANLTTPAVVPFAKALIQNIDRLGFAVERIVPLHGRVVPMSDLRRDAGT